LQGIQLRSPPLYAIPILTHRQLANRLAPPAANDISCAPIDRSQPGSTVF